MSSQLLAECLEKFKAHGFGPEFQSYFMRLKSQFLASTDVACGLVALTAQEDDTSGSAHKVFSLLLDEARMGLENDDEYAEDFLQTVEMAVEAGIAAGVIQHDNLVDFAGLYRRVGLPVPKAFIIDPDTMPPAADMGDFDLSENLEDLARDVMAEGGSAYDLFNAIDSMLAAVPDEIQASLANHISTMQGAVFERCALFMLLSGSELMKEAIMAGLFERLEDSTLSADTMTLLPMVRGWFPKGPVQADLDRLIQTSRLKAMPMQSGAAVPQLRTIVASITDGVGAQSIAVVLQQGSKPLLAMILLKAGYGIKDSFLVPFETDAEAEHMIGQICAETDADDISRNTFRVLVEGALADGLENGCLPAPGFLDVVEACNLFDLRPQELGLQALLDLADPEQKIQAASTQTLGRWINDDVALERLAHLTESWFEDTEETREIIAAGQTARGLETKLWKFLETRRDVWARRFLQTAVMLRDGDRIREWRTLVASAYGLMNRRSLKRIPLMEDIMYTTIEADDAKMW